MCANLVTTSNENRRHKVSAVELYVAVNPVL